jgi:hypothetical protein
MPKTNPAPEEKPVEQAAEPQADLNELEAKLRTLKAQAAELEAKREAAQPAAPTESTPLPGDDRLASEATEDEVARAEILRDPFDTRNALKILADPPGKKLRWISVQYREMRNMKGWTVVRYDDPIGREIHRYIGEPPSRMLGTSEADSVIRRGDVVLAWIDRGIWEARQRRREAEANRKISSHTTRVQRPIGQFGATTGDGLQHDANPYQVLRKAPGFVDPDEHAYRERAKGTVDDPAQYVPGRNMFEEVSDDEE